MSSSTAMLGTSAYAVKAHPHAACQYHANMPKNKSLKQLLSENVRAVMETKGLSQPKVAAAARKAGTPVDQTTVGRILRVEFPATLDTLEAVANGLGVEPWRLLWPEFKPESMALSADERAEVEAAKKILADLSSAQRDFFLQDGIVKDLLTKPPYPVEKMGPGWASPNERKKR